jgi:hypothetical protein
MPKNIMPTSIVSASNRPDLVEVTARWRWVTFFRDTEPFEEVLKRAQRTSVMGLTIPRTLVLLVDDEPVGTVSLTAHDLDEQPRREEARKASIAILWLYTNTAEWVYARVGWRTIETVLHDCGPFALMPATCPNHRSTQCAVEPTTIQRTVRDAVE